MTPVADRGGITWTGQKTTASQNEQNYERIASPALRKPLRIVLNFAQLAALKKLFQKEIA